MTENVIKGYLDVKISSKSRRGFTPWKAWQRQWCEIRRLDDIDVGVELKLRTSEDGNILNCIQVPRSATLCRTDSRTKQFAFGVFNLRKTKKPVIYLAGCSESDSQEWMTSIRKMMRIASYIPVGECNFRISFVDNGHSRGAGLLGLYGVLQVNSQEIIISDPCTGAPKAGWRWYHFHQFHMQATNEHKDDNKIIVMHTSREFPSGPGQLYVYCREGPELLHSLISRGQCSRYTSGLICSKRFSRSESDLCGSRSSVPDSPLCLRSQTGSDDSGVPHSNISEENDFSIKSKTESNLVNLCLSEITKTPGGSETEDSYPDLHVPITEKGKSRCSLIPRNESGISLASGIYEEIPDDHESKNDKIHGDPSADLQHLSHVYENPFELVFDKKLGKYFKPPPLPPRTFNSFTLHRRRETPSSPTSPCKHRCNTLPAKDLSKISQIFNANVAPSESEYVVMSPNRTQEKSKKIILENLYVPMTSPVIQLKNKIVEGVYMSMTGGTKKAT